jgi:hypothetical protein
MIVQVSVQYKVRFRNPSNRAELFCAEQLGLLRVNRGRLVGSWLAWTFETRISDAVEHPLVAVRILERCSWRWSLEPSTSGAWLGVQP